MKKIEMSVYSTVTKPINPKPVLNETAVAIIDDYVDIILPLHIDGIYKILKKYNRQELFYELFEKLHTTDYKEFEDFVKEENLRPDSAVTKSLLCFNTILKTKNYEQLDVISELKDIFNGKICAKPKDSKEQLAILRFIQAKISAAFKSIVQELKNKE